LYRHAELANQLGISFENIFILNNGDIFEFQPQKNSALISGFVQAPGVLIDGSGIGDIDQLVLRDRLLLAEDGVIAVAIAINRQTGEMSGLPSIQARGFIYESESTRIVKDCQKKIADMARKAALSDRSISDLLRSDAVSDQLQQLLYSRTKRRPMILMSVIDI
jgi:ribonuclease J